MLIILFVISQWMSFLKSHEVYDMASYGDNLLIGTVGGALIFNKSATSFSTITNVDGLLSNNIIQVEVDKHGNFWLLCVDGGLTLMSQDKRRVKKFTYMEGLPSYNFSSLFIDGDTIWVGTDDDTKVWMYDTKGDSFGSGNAVLLEVKPTNRVKSISVIGDSVWFGTTKGIGVVRKGGSSWTVYDMDDGLPNDTVLGIAEWNGYIWAGTRKGCARLGPAGWEVVDLSYWCPSPKDTIWIKVHNFCSSNSLFWEATSFGAKKWIGTQFEPIPNSWWDTRVVVPDVDQPTGVWIGTFGTGIGKCNGELHYYNLPSPASNRFASIAVDRNEKVWATHGLHQVSKLYYEDGWNWKIYNKNNEWGIQPWAHASKVIADKENNLWVAMWADNALALVKIMPNDSMVKIKIEGSSPVANCIASICIDAYNNLWIACHDAAIRRIRNDVVDTIITHDYITNWVLALGVDFEGNIWVGDRTNGLVIFLRNGGFCRVSDFPIDEIKFINTGVGNEVWVGTLTKGIYKIKNREIILSYTQEEMGGLVNDMTIDYKGRAWFAVNEVGVKKLESNGSFTTYDKMDGLVSNDVTKIGVFEDILWIGTNYGLSRFDTETLSPGIQRVKVYPNPVVLSKGQGKVFFDSKDLDGSTIHIYTIYGRLVNTVKEIKSSFASWDVRDMYGEFVGSGIYIFVIHTKTGAKKIGKIAVVR